MSDETDEAKPRKASSVRHTRAIQRDRSKRPVSMPTDQQIQERLTEVVLPEALSQVSHFHGMGLRERTLNLPIMVALVLGMIWRQVSGVNELVRVIEEEVILWAAPIKVSQPALSQRLTSLPAELFLKVLEAVLPKMQVRWQERQRPLPAELAWAQAHYTATQAVDGSTLDTLLRKIGLLKNLPATPLAGRMTALLDLGSRLPSRIWYESDPLAHDQRFWPTILSVLKAGSLLIFDMGYINFVVFAQLTLAQVKFITRAKTNLVYTLEHNLIQTASVRDSRVWIGSGDERQLVRLIEVLYRGKWHRYLTNELDLERLPTAYAVALYWQRWRIEDAYGVVKRLLGLAYFWCGAQNAVEMQMWATWLLYAILIDLTDAVAEALHQPFAAISIEMIYRSLYFFARAHQRDPSKELVAYLAEKSKRLGIVKRKRKSDKPSPLVFIGPLTAS